MWPRPQLHFLRRPLQSLGLKACAQPRQRGAAVAVDPPPELPKDSQDAANKLVAPDGAEVHRDLSPEGKGGPRGAHLGLDSFVHLLKVRGRGV